jgi:hypothetical protein
MTQPVRPACAAGVSEVVPTVAPAAFWAGMTSAPAVGFTSLLTSFPQLSRMRRSRSGLMNNFTPPVPPHSAAHSPSSRGHAAVVVVMGGRRTCRDDQRRGHRQVELRTSDGAAGTARSTRACFLTRKPVAAVGSGHRSARPLGTVLVRAVAGEPDQPPIAIESSDGLDDHGDCVRGIVDNAPRLTEPQSGRLATLLRLHAGANQTRQEAWCRGGHFTSRRHPAAAAAPVRAEGRHR